MFSLLKKQPVKRAPRKYGVYTKYKQVCVTPRAHAKLRKMAEKQNKTMVEMFSNIIEA